MVENTDFSLTQLRYFVVAAEMGNISQAAQTLHASQSAVSMAIQRLEKQLGTPLFFRHRTKGVSLTPGGRILLADARALLLQAQELRARSREWHGEIHGRLDVAFLPSITPFVFPALLCKLKLLHPQLTVTVHEGTADEVHELLLSGACELAVTSELPEREFAFTRLATVPLSALVSPSDPLASSGCATLKELAAQPFLVVDGPADHPVSMAMQRLFVQADVSVPQAVQLPSIGTMLGMVGAGAGFALMRQGMVGSALFDGCAALIDVLSDSPCVSDVGVTTLRGQPFSRRAQEFISVLYETVPEVYCTAEDSRGVA